MWVNGTVTDRASFFDRNNSAYHNHDDDIGNVL